MVLTKSIWRMMWNASQFQRINLAENLFQNQKEIYTLSWNCIVGQWEVRYAGKLLEYFSKFWSSGAVIVLCIGIRAVGGIQIWASWGSEEAQIKSGAKCLSGSSRSSDSPSKHINWRMSWCHRSKPSKTFASPRVSLWDNITSQNQKWWSSFD